MTELVLLIGPLAPGYRFAVIDEDESGDGASKALVAPASTSRLPVARSLADAAPGEMVFVDGRGQALTRRQVTAVKARYWAVVVAGGLSVGLVYGVLTAPIFGVIAAVAIELMAVFTLRHWPLYRTALAHFAACQWEEAHASLLALEQRRLTPDQR